MRQYPRGMVAGIAGLFMAGLVASSTPANAAPPVAAAALSAQSIPASLAATKPAAETDHAIVRNVTVAKGDTLMGLLVGAGSAPADAAAAIVAIKKSFDPRKLRVGHQLTLIFDDRGAGAPRLAVVNLALAKGRYLVAQREGGRYVASRATAVLVPRFDAPLTNRGGTRTMTVRKGETLMKVLLRAGAAPREAGAAIDALVRHFNPRHLQVGQQLTVVFAPGATRARLAAVSLTLGPKGYIIAGRDGDGGFTANKAAAPIEPAQALAAAEAAEAAAPEKAAAEETTTAALTEPESEADAVEPAPEPAAPTMPASRRDDAVEKTVIIRKGDTLMRVLRRAGSDKKEANAAITALSRHFNPRRLQVGQELTVVFIPASAGRLRLAAVSLTLGKDSHLVAGRQTDGDFSSTPTTAPLSAALDAVIDGVDLPKRPEVVLAPAPEGAVRKSMKLKPGDTLMVALMRAGCDPREAHDAIVALSELYNPRKLKVGQVLTVVMDADEAAGRAVLHGITLASSPGYSVEVGRAAAGDFYAAREIEVPMARELIHIGGRIDSSLYQSAVEVGMPVPVLMEMIKAFSFDVDFQREIQRGDSFTVLFERFVDDTGLMTREGAVLFGELTLSGEPLRIYRHVLADGAVEYYNEDGHGIRKALLRTPIDGARLTSGYGKRKHPINGYTKMHRGVDFGAATGTPIVAAGGGVVEMAGWNGGYGRYIRIRHKGQYATAYAHMKGIAKGVKKGKRVRQGQIIGYVGASGKATGPHLHYEVLRNGRQMNPLSVRLPTGVKLGGAALAAFERVRATIDAQLSALPLMRRIAEAGAEAAPCGARLASVHAETC